MSWSLVARDFGLEKHFVRLGAIGPLLTVMEGGSAIRDSRAAAASAAAALAAQGADDAFEAACAAVGYYGRDRAGAKRKLVEAAAIEAAATAEKAVSTQGTAWTK